MSLGTSAYQQLRDMIVNGKLAPGTWVIEADLAARLGYSRTPIRGALQLLQQEGYVIGAPNSGSKSRMLVAPLTKEDARELYSIIGHLEGLSARLTAQLPLAKRRETIALLKTFNKGLMELAKVGHSDAQRIFELDLNFHRTVVEASAGPRLLEIHRTVQPQAERYWRLYAGAILEELDKSTAEHEEIIAAISAGDADQAELAIRRNWQNGVDRLSQLIDTLGERGSR
ncbi:MAG TPA: GntR family transcriptional regulator [Bryobacteraceae bacterium]|nr:GntR family transcriptional regulator [Bryobacteraceae bacterium]